MNKILKYGVNKFLRMFGLEIHKIYEYSEHRFDRTFNRIKHLKKMGFYPDVIFDVGASNGNWTRRCLEIYPQAQFFCFEPLEENKTSLNQLCSEYPNVSYFQGCLGSQKGIAILNADSDGSSILTGHWGNPYGNRVEINVETLDNLIEQNKCMSPDLIKLDVQGYELEVLKGALTTTRKAQAIISEVSFFPFQKDMPLFHEVVNQLSRYGFVVWDILSLNMRPLDGAAAQTDLLFLKKSHPLRSSNKWDHKSIY